MGMRVISLCDDEAWIPLNRRQSTILFSGAVRARLDAVPVRSVTGTSASSHNSIHLGMSRSGDVNAAAATGTGATEYGRSSIV